MWNWLKSWWDNKKGVIKDFVIPQLDGAIEPLVALIVSKGVDEAKARVVALAIVAEIKTILIRQL